MTEAIQRRGRTSLIVAWLALLAVVTAGATYLVLARHTPTAQQMSGLTIAIPSPMESEIAALPASEGVGEFEGGSATESAAESATESATESAMESAAESAKASNQAVADGGQPPASPELAPSQVALSTASDLPAWRRYASVYQATREQPRIAVVLTGLGFSSQATESAIEDLPPGVTLSFTPYVDRLPEWIARARGNGHEVMLDLPMEPAAYPDDDPGPQALLTQLDELQNQQRLHWVLGRAEGYVGLTAVMGDRFAGSEPHLKPILQEIKAQGLMYLDNRASEAGVAARVAQDLKLPHAVNNRLLDDGDVGRLTIDARLAQIERMAMNDGASIAIGRPYPATLERLSEWIKTLDARGFELVPITVLAQGSG